MLVALAAGAAIGQPLTAAEQATLRAGAYKSARDATQSEAERLAAALGAAGREEALPLLLQLQSPLLLDDYTRFYVAPASPSLQRWVLEHRRTPQTGWMLLRTLHRWSSRELFDALVADLRAAPERPGPIVRALLDADVPGMDATLLDLLPVLAAEESRLVARHLATRGFLPAQPVLLDMLRGAPLARGYTGLGATAEAVLPLGTQPLMDAAARALADARTLPPTPGGPPVYGRIEGALLERIRLTEQNEDLARLIQQLAVAPAHVRLDPALFPASLVDEFAPEHRQRLREMLARRQEAERRFAEVSVDNFLHWAGHGRPEQLRSFMSRGARIDWRNAAGETALIAAAKYGRHDNLGMLLAAGADPSAADVEGTTALHVLARSYLPPNDSSDPVLRASSRFVTAQVNEAPLADARMLIGRGAKVSAAARDGRTPLHIAVATRFEAMVRLLAESGADINAEAQSNGLQGLRPLQLAQDIGDERIAAYLRSRGGSVNYGFATRRAAAAAATRLLAPLLHSH